MKPKRPEFLRFVAVGGIAALVNILSRYAVNTVMAYEYAVIVAYIFGMITAFILSKAFVFAHAAGGKAHGQFLRFTLVNVMAAAQVWGISVGLAEYLFPRIGFAFHPYDTAHIVGVIFPVFSSYFGHKYFSFRPAREQS
jgi:putative flippase GtrA